MKALLTISIWLWTSVAFCQSSLFVTGSQNGRALAGKYNLAALNSAKVVDRVQVVFYGDSTCSAADLDADFTGPGYTFNPGATVNISAQGIWEFGTDNAVNLATIGSVEINPFVGLSAAFTTAVSCFTVTCAGGQCVGSDILARTLAP